MLALRHSLGGPPRPLLGATAGVPDLVPLPVKCCALKVVGTPLAWGVLSWRRRQLGWGLNATGGIELHLYRQAEARWDFTRTCLCQGECFLAGGPHFECNSRQLFWRRGTSQRKLHSYRCAVLLRGFTVKFASVEPASLEWPAGCCFA